MDGDKGKPMSGLDGGDEAAHVEGASFHMFDPWLATTHPLSKAIAANITDYIERYGDSDRKRRIRQQDKENRTAVIHALYANMAYAKALATARRYAGPVKVGISLRAPKRTLTRYDRRGFASLPRIIETVAAGQHESARMFSLEKSRQRGEASTITLTPWFASQFDSFKLIPQHFRRIPGGELIWLTQTSRDFVDDSRHIEPIDYKDTSETTRFRAELNTINAHLSAADIGFIPDSGPLVIVTDRELHRQFKLPLGEELPRFDLCGRLFGGWWQTLKSERRAGIRIDGEPIADLDFSNMFLRLAYIQAGHEPPAGDLYAAISGFEAPQWRPGIKKAVNALLCREGEMQRLPRKIKPELPARTSAAQIRDAVIASHPLVADILEAGRGLHLMFTESQILVNAMLRLIAEDVTALPMHDGLMVARSKADIAAKAMGDASEAVTGIRLPISLKSQY